MLFDNAATFFAIISPGRVTDASIKTTVDFRTGRKRARHLHSSPDVNRLAFVSNSKFAVFYFINLINWFIIFLTPSKTQFTIRDFSANQKSNLYFEFENLWLQQNIFTIRQQNLFSQIPYKSYNTSKHTHTHTTWARLNEIFAFDLFNIPYFSSITAIRF